MNIFAPKEYETSGHKWGDFAIGFALWFVLNTLMLAALWVVTGFLTDPSVSNNPALNQALGYALLCMSVLPLIVNIGLIIFFAMRRRWIALGMLGALSGTLLLVVCAAIVFLAACFTIIGGVP